MRRNLVTIVALPLMLAALAVPSYGPGAVVAVAVFFACFPIALVLHEAGHALVGRAGGSVSGWWKSAWGGGSPGSTSGARRWSSGPSRSSARSTSQASAAAFVVGRWWVPVPSLAAGLMVAGGLHCLASLWPRRRSPALGLPTDGYQLFNLLRAKPDRITAAVTAGWARDVAEAHGQGRSEEAVRRLDRAEAECPGDLLLAILRAELLAETSPTEALAAFRPLLDRAAEPPLRAAVLNGIAYTALLSWDPDLLAEADRASAEACELAPTIVALWDTRGLALIRTGRAQEGIELAERALRTPLTVRAAARVRCVVALGQAAVGDRVGANDHLERARAVLPADDLLLRRVSDAVSPPVPAGA